jgi:hypothetical protein
MLLFCAGFIVGGLLGMIALASYKRTLQMVAETTQSELINGVWYRITKEESDGQRNKSR